MGLIVLIKHHLFVQTPILYCLVLVAYARFVLGKVSNDYLLIWLAKSLGLPIMLQNLIEIPPYFCTIRVPTLENTRNEILEFTNTNEMGYWGIILRIGHHQKLFERSQNALNTVLDIFKCLGLILMVNTSKFILINNFFLSLGILVA